MVPTTCASNCSLVGSNASCLTATSSIYFFSNIPPKICTASFFFANKVISLAGATSSSIANAIATGLFKTLSSTSIPYFFRVILTKVFFVTLNSTFFSLKRLRSSSICLTFKPLYSTITADFIFSTFWSRDSISFVFCSFVFAILILITPNFHLN